MNGWSGSRRLTCMLLVAGAVNAMSLASAAARQSAASAGPLPWAVEISPGAIRPRAGCAYTTSLSLPAEAGDATGHLRRSSWVLLENDVPIGPGHSLHAAIESKGRGRYSHWGGALVFAASDNTDPRTNGRTYLLVRGADESGNRIHFDSPGSMMMLRVGERLWWPSGDRFELFGPRFGSRRPEVNPVRPRVEQGTLIFERPGEYGIRWNGRAIRLLVLEPDVALQGRQIVSFVAANTTGGREDEVPSETEALDWSVVIRSHYDRLFQSDDSLDIACARSALITDLLCRAAGLEVRYCGWLGDDPKFAAHTGLEIFNARRGQWEYYDPHFGVSAKDRSDAVSLALSLQRLYNQREDAAFASLVDKITPAELADQFHSCRAALQLWTDRSRRTSVVLLLRDTIPATIQPDEFRETEFISASKGLAGFRARFYESRTADATDTPPSR